MLERRVSLVFDIAEVDVLACFEVFETRFVGVELGVLLGELFVSYHVWMIQTVTSSLLRERFRRIYVSISPIEFSTCPEGEREGGVVQWLT
ncbi:hypothetical protein [Halegenticoccus tardaugens]|uniref:hypothetical protein n=1 Tax=Halegenticoccus tardaugens TaxID=2071624 RepID=UPI00100BA410|nr:hypothetical protein [Halegenticoccus tardaugens]